MKNGALNKILLAILLLRGLAPAAAEDAAREYMESRGDAREQVLNKDGRGQYNEEQTLAEVKAFFDAIPSRTHDETSFKDSVILADEWSELFTSLVKKSKVMQDAGFCAESIERYVTPRIVNIHLANDLGSSWYLYHTGTMSLAQVKDSTKLAQSALHETMHAVIGPSDDYVQDITELALGFDKPSYPAALWDYSTRHLKPIRERAYANGQAARYWAAGSSNDAFKSLWDEYSPKYEHEGRQHNVLENADLDRLRYAGKILLAYKVRNDSGITVYDKDYDPNADYENDIDKLQVNFAGLYDGLTELANDLEKCYTADNAFKTAVAQKIKTFLTENKIERNPKWDNTDRDFMVRIKEFGEWLSTFAYGYGNEEVHEHILKLETLGIRKDAIVRGTADGVVGMSCGRVLEEAWVDEIRNEREKAIDKMAQELPDKKYGEMTEEEKQNSLQ